MQNDEKPMAAPRWTWRAFRLAEDPAEVWLVTAASFGEIVAGQRGAGGADQDNGAAAGANGARAPQRLPRDKALTLFDRACRQPTFALRAFVRDNGVGPSLGLIREHHLVSYVRQEIAVGGLVALRPGAEPQPAVILRERVEPPPTAASAPMSIRRAPPEPEVIEGPDFPCAGPQAETLRAAAASGAPFCEVCQRQAAERAAGGGR